MTGFQETGLGACQCCAGHWGLNAALFCCLLPSAILLSPEESLLLPVSKHRLGICQLGLDWQEEGALPQACASAVCLLPGRGPPGTLARCQLSSAELVFSPAFLTCPQPSPWSHLLAGSQLDPNLERLGVLGWGWEGGKEGELGARSGAQELLQKGELWGAEAGPRCVGLPRCPHPLGRHTPIR